MAVSEELKGMPIPPDSDPRKRRVMKAGDSSCEQWQLTDGRQPCSCRDADTAKFDGRRVKNGCRGGRERRIQKFESPAHQTKNCHENID